MSTNRVRYIKLVDNKSIYSQIDNEFIIASCFDSCTDSVKKGVRWWIANPRCKKMTLSFKEFKVRLEKV